MEKFIYVDAKDLLKDFANYIAEQQIERRKSIVNTFNKLPVCDKVYVAGGSALLLAQYYFYRDHDEDSLMKVLFAYDRLDIDIFFNDQESYLSYQPLVDSLFGVSSSSEFEQNKTHESKYAKTYNEGLEFCRVQLIKCQFGSVEDIISRFDLINSMCAYDLNRQRFILHEEVPDLIKNKTLKVDKILHPGTFKRIHKYLTGKNLSKLESTSNQKIYDGFEKFYLLLKEQAKDSPTSISVLTQMLHSMKTLLNYNGNKFDLSILLAFSPFFSEISDSQYSALSTDIFLNAVRGTHEESTFTQ